MYISINNLIESIANPSGRFATLEGIYPYLDADGEPCYEILGGVINFRVCYDHKDWFLKCLIDDTNAKSEHYRSVAFQLSKLHKNNVLMNIRFFANEMLVYSSSDRPLWIDVGLVEIAHGLPLDQYVLQMCDSRNHKAMETLRIEFCRSAAELLDSGFVHGNIKPSNIIVDRAGKVKFVRYYRAIPPDTPAYAYKRNADTVPVALIVTVLTVIAQDLSLYRILGGSLIFRFSALRETVIPALLESLKNMSEISFSTMVNMLIDCNDMIRDRDQLSVLLMLMADESIRFKIDVSNIPKTQSVRVDNEDIEPIVIEAPFDESLYDAIEDGGEYMRIVSKGDLYGCLNNDNKEVAPIIYQSVGIFCEGRSVVVRDDYEGLIDNNGTEVIPALLDSVSWYADSGVALCESDGSYWICDRSGNKVVDLDYDWVGDMSSGLLPVRAGNGKCGYIDKYGTVIIPLIYDDVYSFSDATARVLLGSTEYIINLQGELSSTEPKSKIKIS